MMHNKITVLTTINILLNINMHLRTLFFLFKSVFYKTNEITVLEKNSWIIKISQNYLFLLYNKYFNY